MQQNEINPTRCSGIAYLIEVDFIEIVTKAL